MLAGTERFFDISGSLTFLAVGALSLYLPQLRARVGNAALPKLLNAFGGGAWNWRQVVVTGMAVTWATRCTLTRLSIPPHFLIPTLVVNIIMLMSKIVGVYLFQRITQDGHDPRFEKLRTRPLRFAVSFFLQAVWVSLMLMPVMALNAVPAVAFAAIPRLTATDILGIGLWTTGIALETAADIQKSRWVEGKKKKEHDEQFLKTGLFAMW